MKKKFLALTLATFFTIASAASLNASAYYSNDDTWYPNRSTGERIEYSNAHNHFTGWGWDFETSEVYRGNVSVGTLKAYFNRELIGNEKAYSKEISNVYNTAVDCLVNTEGSTLYSPTAGYGYDTQTDILSIPNGGPVKWWHFAYWY